MKGSELEMDLQSGLPDKSVSSPEKEEKKDGSTPKEENIFITCTKFKSHNPIVREEEKFYYSLLKRINI